MRSSVIFSGLIGIFIMLLMVAGGLNYRFNTMLFPYIIGIPTVILCIIQIIEGMKKERESSEGGEVKNDKRNYLRASAWIAGFIVALYSIGYVLAIPLFLVIYLKLHGERWLLTIIVSGVVLGIIWGTFALWLRVPLHQGVLFH